MEGTVHATGAHRSEVAVNRYLVVANQTIESPLLLEALRQRNEEPGSSFHLLVPEDHTQHSTWDESEARHAAKLRLTKSGGAGAVREFVELLLRARGDWDTQVERYVASRSEER